MLFLADENCDFAVVRALRADGHDVVSVAEIAPRMDDRDVIALATREDRILLTEDKDFGQLVYAGLHESSGVILIRFPQNARWALPGVIREAVQKLEGRLRGAFVVLKPNQVRIGRKPEG